MTALPRIVRFVGTSDAPDSTCPHCGATGRYITTFVVEDGRTLGAMRGCLKLFPVAPVAAAHAWLLDKQARYTKQGWKLNRDDQYALDQIFLFYAGVASEQYALDMYRAARRSGVSRQRARHVQ